MFLLSSANSFCNWQRYVPLNKKVYDHKPPLLWRSALVGVCSTHWVTFIADEDLRGAGRDNLKKHSF